MDPIFEYTETSQTVQPAAPAILENTTPPEKKNKTLPAFVGFFVIALILISAGVGVKLFITQFDKSYPTYFSYTQKELDSLKRIKTKEIFQASDLYTGDEAAFSFIKSLKLPPTTASKVIAHLLVAQRDAYYVSYNASGKFQGNFTAVNKAVLCSIFQKNCNSVIKTSSQDEYSKKLASIVLSKLEERTKNEARTISLPAQKFGSEYWGGTDPTTPEASTWKPWLMTRASDFRAPPPPKYNSEGDLKEIKLMRENFGQLDTQKLKAIYFWAGSAGTETPAGIWLGIADNYSKTQSLTVQKAVDFRFVFASSMADAFISCWNTKFMYWTKRPTMRDDSIHPYIPTPNFPSYVSGHATVSAAAAFVLSHFFPENKTEWEKMAQEATDSRFWSGLHFKIDNDEGARMGKKIASMAISLNKNSTKLGTKKVVISENPSTITRSK